MKVSDNQPEREVKEAKENPEHPESFSRVSANPERLQARDVPLNEHSGQKGEGLSRMSELNANREKRSEITEGMISRGRPLLPEKQKDNSKDLHYLGEKLFAGELKKRDPGVSDGDISLTEGFHDRRDNQAFVKDQGETLTTSLHEKLHQKSQSDLPLRLNEGVTENLAREKAGYVGELKNIDGHGRVIDKPVSDYEHEVRVSRQLDALAGRESLDKAYFLGDSSQLQQRVDAELGKGSFDRLGQVLEERDYQKADKIIERHKK